jgi:hypothetical protein
MDKAFVEYTEGFAERFCLGKGHFSITDEVSLARDIVQYYIIICMGTQSIYGAYARIYVYNLIIFISVFCTRDCTSAKPSLL